MMGFLLLAKKAPDTRYLLAYDTGSCDELEEVSYYDILEFMLTGTVLPVGFSISLITCVDCRYIIVSSRYTHTGGTGRVGVCL